jgi:hypothetical protein
MLWKLSFKQRCLFLPQQWVTNLLWGLGPALLRRLADDYSNKCPNHTAELLCGALSSKQSPTPNNDAEGSRQPTKNNNDS